MALAYLLLRFFRTVLWSSARRLFSQQKKNPSESFSPEVDRTRWVTEVIITCKERDKDKVNMIVLLGIRKHLIWGREEILSTVSLSWTSYLPAVGMLQRLQHTAAIVLLLGRARSSIIRLLSPVGTSQTGTPGAQLASLTGAPCALQSHALLWPHIFTLSIVTFAITLRISLYVFVFLNFFHFSLACMAL